MFAKWGAYSSAMKLDCSYPTGGDHTLGRGLTNSQRLPYLKKKMK
jgi:hypothetical protein